MAGMALLRSGFRCSRLVGDRRSLGIASQHVRYAAKLATVERNQAKQDENVEEKEKVVYLGPMSGTLRRVKLLSFTTFSLSITGGPFVTFYTYPDVSLFIKASLAATMMMLSASTTAALHWFASPYVHRMSWVPASEEVEVHTLSLVGTPVRRIVHLSDIRAPETQRPLVTFAAKDKCYFVDEENFPNAELLKKLVAVKAK